MTMCSGSLSVRRDSRRGVSERNYGFPQEFAHFVDCVRNDGPPLVTGADGRTVMQIVFGADKSAGTGKRVELPFSPPENAAPIGLWRP